MRLDAKSKRLKLAGRRQLVKVGVMKIRILFGIFAVFALFLLLPLALAKADKAKTGNNQVLSAKSEAGITPDSHFYFLDTTLEKLQLGLTFDKAAKARKAIEIAQEKLQEVKAMAAEGKPDKADQAEKEYENDINVAIIAANGIESSDNAAAPDVLRKIAVLQNQTESHYEKIIEVKDEILGRQAGRMDPAQIAHLEGVFSKIESKAREMEVKLDSKKEKVKIKHEALSNLTVGQSNDLENQINEKTGLAKGRQERAARHINK